MVHSAREGQEPCQRGGRGIQFLKYFARRRTRVHRSRGPSIDRSISILPKIGCRHGRGGTAEIEHFTVADGHQASRRRLQDQDQVWGPLSCICPAVLEMASAERRHTSAPAESEKGRDTRGARFGGRSSCTSCFTESLV